MKKEWGADLCHNVGGFLSRYETRVFGQMGNHGYYSFIFFLQGKKNSADKGL